MKKILFVQFLIGVFALSLFTSCQKDDGIQAGLDRPEIRPGEGVLDFQFRDRLQIVIDKYGAPPSTGETQIQDKTTFDISYPGLGIGFTTYVLEQSVEFNPGLIIGKMQVWGPFSGTTKEGIGIGSSEQQIIDAYGTGYEEFQFGGLIYHDLGVFFTLDESKRVQSISVFENWY